MAHHIILMTFVIFSTRQMAYAPCGYLPCLKIRDSFMLILWRKTYFYCLWRTAPLPFQLEEN